MFVACTHFHRNRSPAPRQDKRLSVCWHVLLTMPNKPRNISGPLHTNEWQYYNSSAKWSVHIHQQDLHRQIYRQNENMKVILRQILPAERWKCLLQTITSSFDPEVCVPSGTGHLTVCWVSFPAQTCSLYQLDHVLCHQLNVSIYVTWNTLQGAVLRSRHRAIGIPCHGFNHQSSCLLALL